jgi:PAS domain S-box-containing protein
LRIVAARGFSQRWIAFFNEAKEGSAASCSEALHRSKRVVVVDVMTSRIFAGTEALDVQIGDGVRAIQSTPLVTRSGKVLGMISTHFAAPHRPARRDLHWLDLLVRQAADLIERDLGEKTLLESEERFRLLADGVPMLIWMADENANMTYVNRALRELWGATGLGTVLGRAWEHLIHPDDVARTHEIYGRAIKARVPYSLEMRVRDARAGQFRWHLVKGVPRFVAGRFDGFIGTGIDIHDRKLAEDELRKSEERYRMLFNSIDEGFCVIEIIFDEVKRPIDYRFLEINPAFEKESGLKNAQGRLMRDLVPKHEQHWFDTYGKIALTGEPARFQKLAAELGRWYDVYAFRIGEPEARQVAVLFNDITGQKRRREELEKAVAERTAALSATVAELEGVSYSLSHDMRAPLRTIRSFSEIVLQQAKEKIAPREQELLQKVINSAGRMDRLIQDVLTYSRVAREAISLQPLNVEHLIRQIIEERPELQLPIARIEIEGPLPPLRGHEAYLTQCITNLLDNAVKFVPPGTQPQVRIWAEPAPSTHSSVESSIHPIPSGFARLWFEDNGIGIPVEAQQRIFEIFQRVHDNTTYSGTGIGLAIVRKAAERMGGSAGVQSEEGHGSRFWLQLPQA